MAAVAAALASADAADTPSFRLLQCTLRGLPGATDPVVTLQDGS